jgi:uncharacterized protein YvpB
MGRGILARRVLTGVVLLGVPAVTLSGSSSPRTTAAPRHLAAAPLTPGSQPTPTPSPTPSLAPTSSPTAAAVAVRATPPPPAPPSAPAHPPAAPPPPPVAPPAGVTIPVPWQHQVYNLSCEESALSMVLAFYGRSVSDQDVLTYIGVDTVHYWTGAGGGDPFVDFVGDPNGSEVIDPTTGRNTGYGTYWPTIQSAARQFGATVAQAGQGISPSAVYSAVSAGHPVIVWVTFDLASHARTDYVAYDGQSIPYAGPWEHAMVVTGVDGTDVRLNDPDRGQYWISRGQFETAYAVYGQMAVIFQSAGPTPTPAATPSPAPSATLTPTPSPTPTPTPGATSPSPG